jgi:hypothetical protein
VVANAYGAEIDTDSADIQPLGPEAQAGDSLMAAASDHVHPDTGIWPGTTEGDMAYGGSGGVQTRLPGNTSAQRRFLLGQGDGSTASAPDWSTLEIGDLPASGATAWINVTGSDYGADPTGSTYSDAAINSAARAAIAYGLTVYIPAGLYSTEHPLIDTPGVRFLGDWADQVSTYQDALFGTVIQPSAEWSQGSCPASGVIVALGQTDASPNYPTVSVEQKIEGIHLDCHLMWSSPGETVLSGLTGVDGIQFYGNVSRPSIEHVLVSYPPNNGLNFVTSSGSGLGPDAPHCYRLNIRYAGNYGVNHFKISDATYKDCLVENALSDGWSITNASNGLFEGCRSEHNGGNGYTWTCTSSGTGSGGCKFVGCSSDRNSGDGIKITSTDNAGVPLILGNCDFRRDGCNTVDGVSTGGGSFCGIEITSYPASSGSTDAAAVVQIGNCNVFPGVDDTGSGALSPQYGLRIHGNNNGLQVLVGTSYFQGASVGIGDDGSGGATLYDLATLQATGSTSSPAILGPRQGTATLSGGTVVVPCTCVRSASLVIVTPSSVGVNSGSLGVSSISPGVSFTVKSTDSSDANSFSWLILNA